MTTQQPDFTINRPGALVAALPALLGFVPENSLVLVTVSDGELGSVLRVDLTAELIDAIDHLADVATAAEPSEMIAVIIDADGARCPVCNEQHRLLCDVLTEQLAQREVTLRATHIVDRVDAGGRWHCGDGCGAGGAVDDPIASPLAAAAVLEGRRLYSRREDLQAVIAVDVETAAAVSEFINERTREDNSVGVSADESVHDILQMVCALADGHRPDVKMLAEAGIALAEVTVRDTLFGLAISARADEAEALWALLVRTLPEPWRAEALALLAFSAYARGDGPLAGVALEAALRCIPNHRMAGMLDTALQSGLRPDRIRELANTGYRIAAQLGVRLPERNEPGQRAS